MSKLAFLSGSSDPVSDAAPESAPEVVETPQTDGPLRGPDGKFAAKDQAETPAPEPVQADTPTPAPETPPVVAEAPQPPPEPAHAPLTALLDERDKRQKAEAAAASAQAELQRLRQQPPPQAPDRNDDPDGFAAYQEAQVDQRLRNQELRFSQRLATVKYGEETVQKAHEWGHAKCDSDPLFNQRVMVSDDPYELIVAEWKWDQARSKIDDLDAYLAWKAQQGDPTQQTPAQPASAPASAVPPPPKPAPPAPPRSIASASSAGGPAAVATGPGQAFDSLFHRK